MKVSEMFPSKYLRAADIPAGKEVPVTVSHLEMVSVEGEEEQKPCLYFEGAKKGLILNKTNSSVIAERLGDDTDNWPGKVIALYATTTPFGGKMVACIRVRVPEIAATETPLPPVASVDAEAPTAEPCPF